MAGAPVVQLADGGENDFRGGGTPVEITAGVNSGLVATQADLDAGRNFRVSLAATGFYCQRGLPAELTANTGAYVWCPPNKTTIIALMRVGESVRISAALTGT